MKFSFKSKVDINQDLQIVVPNKDIQEQVLIKLRAAQKDSKLKGFRKGKAPIDVVESIYGPVLPLIHTDYIINKFKSLCLIVLGRSKIILLRIEHLCLKIIVLSHCHHTSHYGLHHDYPPNILLEKVNILCLHLKLLLFLVLLVIVLVLRVL